MKKLFTRGELVRVIYEGQIFIGILKDYSEHTVVLRDVYRVIMYENSLRFLYIGRFFINGNFSIMDVVNDEVNLYEFAMLRNLHNVVFDLSSNVNNQRESNSGISHSNYIVYESLSKMVH